MNYTCCPGLNIFDLGVRSFEITASSLVELFWTTLLLCLSGLFAYSFCNMFDSVISFLIWATIAALLCSCLKVCKFCLLLSLSPQSSRYQWPSNCFLYFYNIRSLKFLISSYFTYYVFISYYFSSFLRCEVRLFI